MNINIPDINIEIAIKNSGSEELFLELLGDVYKLMDEKISMVESYLEQGNIPNYTIEVHSLKTTCRMIGAMDLGEDFFFLEKLGKDNNLEEIQKQTPAILDSFRALKPLLEPFAIKNNVSQKSYNKDAIFAVLDKLIYAVNDFDLGTAESSAKELLSYEFQGQIAKQIQSLDELIANLDYDEAKELASQIRSSL
jgi:HPt (histidine-containing phosphotransfer) domain-containing protein